MPNEYAKVFALKFRQLRTDCKKTQDEIAEILDVTQQTVQIWEKGEHTPKIATLVKVARHFNVTVDWLLGIDSSPQIIEKYSDNEKYLISLYRQLNIDDKDVFVGFINVMLLKNKEKETSSAS
ncbi:MAG: helix-turn-helix transcriptional regulator [Acidaminococcaceae bacterium]|nr:helix-turn-helix transcriptional regulator [Acidaminococcaceae bacterium]